MPGGWRRAAGARRGPGRRVPPCQLFSSVDQAVQLAAVEEDAPAVRALVDVDAVALVGRMVPWHFGQVSSMPRTGVRA